MRFQWLHPSSKRVNHELIWGSIGLAAILAARFFPFGSAPSMHCPFLITFGYPCFSCGMTRSFRAMSGLNILDAFMWNPVGAAFFIFIFLYVIYAWTVLLFRLPRLHIRTKSSAEEWTLRILVLAIIIGNWTYVILAGRIT